jgi:hypothetical protein
MVYPVMMNTLGIFRIKDSMQRGRIALQMTALIAATGFLFWGAGCTSVISPAGTMVATSSREVRTTAWEGAEKLVAILEQVDAEKHPGIAALVEDLKTAAETVNAGPEGNFEMLDARALLTDNPNLWRARLEMAPGDGTVAALEALVMAAAGEIEHAYDLVELLRAGPLMDESLDRLISHQRNLIRGWRLNPPALDANLARGVPAQERWRPLKQLQANYPDSPTVALAVLRMRTDLAEIELVAQGEDQRMRNKILAAEPAAMEALEAGQPLYAAIVKASGESADAAKRITESLSVDGIGVLNLSESDFEKLVADLVRIGLPDWALRALQLKVGEAGQIGPADVETMRELLPMVVGDEAAKPALAKLSAGELGKVAIFGGGGDPVGRSEVPMDPVVVGHFERLRRDAMALLELGAPTEEEERDAWGSVAESERAMGNYGRAREALDRYAALSKKGVGVSWAKLSLAIATQDRDLAIEARGELQKTDRKLKETHFSRGIAEVMLGDDRAAADAFLKGFENKFADPDRRAFSALHAHGVAQLAGGSQVDEVVLAKELVEEDEWIAKLLATVLGEMDAEQLLAQAEEGRDYLIVGRRCEAHFALAFTPGQTEAGRRRHLEACARTGMISYIEYEIALAWLRRVAPRDWPVPVGDAPGLRREMPAGVESVRVRTLR